VDKRDYAASILQRRYAELIWKQVLPAKKGVQAPLDVFKFVALLVSN